MSTPLLFRQAAAAPAPAQRFSDKVRAAGIDRLASAGIRVLQANLGYRCNMACVHCHVGAGPARTECMSRETAQAVLDALYSSPIRALDITGGAPELNPFFRMLVSGAKQAGKKVMVRTNLTVFFEKGMEDLPDYYREQGVEVIASLPCYLEQNVNAARGRDAYAKSIKALRTLNEQGYGTDRDGSLPLSLVYNPGGTYLPPDQGKLEADYKRELKNSHNISFTNLYAFANMPIGRFRETLARQGELEKYLSVLAARFNPGTLDKVMCRSILSVGWDGRLFDCDFNQALNIPVVDEAHRSIDDFDYEALSRRVIAVDDHCYGCTAGQGSS